MSKNSARADCFNSEAAGGLCEGHRDVTTGMRQREDLRRWKSLYGRMGGEEMRRLQTLDEGHRRLKQLVGEQALDIQALRAIVEGKD